MEFQWNCVPQYCLCRDVPGKVLPWMTLVVFEMELKKKRRNKGKKNSENIIPSLPHELKSEKSECKALKFRAGSEEYCVEFKLCLSLYDHHRIYHLLYCHRRFFTATGHICGHFLPPPLPDLMAYLTRARSELRSENSEQKNCGTAGRTAAERPGMCRHD